MTIEEAIKNAFDEGWKGVRETDLLFRIMNNYSFEAVNWILPKAFLDPTFWQSLGKAMGWGKRSECHDAELYRSVATFENNGMFVPDWYNFCKECKKVCRIKGEYENWIFYWHKFIDHLAEGKTAEDYFKSL